MLEQNVDARGGIVNKYQILVNALLNDPQAHITKVERDRIVITMRTANTFTEFIILENFDDFEISWNANLGVLGTRKHKWTYPKNTSQYKVLEDIRNYMNDKLKNRY